MPMDTRQLADISTRELANLLRPRDQAPRSVGLAAEAFRALAMREQDGGVLSLIRAAMVDRAVAPSVRASSALFLGSMGALAESQADLQRVLHDTEPTVARRAAEALGRIGDVQALAALETMSTNDRVVDRARAVACSLVSYRNGLGTHLIDPIATARLPERARHLPATSLGNKQERDSLTVAATRSIAFPLLSIEHAIAFQCGRNSFAVALTNGIETSRSNALLGMVFEKGMATGQFALAEYLLLNIGRRGDGQIIGMRPSGEILHSGTLSTGGHFTIGTVPNRVFPPLDAVGQLNTAAGRFDEVALRAAGDQPAIPDRAVTPLERPSPFLR